MMNLKRVFALLWQNIKSFVTRIASIIIAMNVVLWFLARFTARFEFISSQDQSISLLQTFGMILSPIFSPLGFGSWGAVSALLAGLVAKEVVVSSIAMFNGVNVFKDGDWFVSLGGKNDVINILPPFNGEGDHLIFEVSEKTYFRKYNMPYYNLLTNTNYSLIEEFVHPYKILCAGFAWFHLNAMRNKCYEKVRGIRELLPSTFIQISNFVNLKYRDILNKADKNMFSLRQTVLFSFIYKSDKASIKKNVDLLEKLPF